MKQWQILIAVVVLALISAAGGYQLQQYLKSDETEQIVAVQKPLTPKSVMGSQVKNFSLFDVNGKQRNLKEWQGKIIVINFWATWCAPCREEIPAFIELQQQYANDGLQFIGIALQTAEEIRDFINEFSINYPSLVGAGDVINIAKNLGNDIGALPYTVIIDRSGIITFTRRGPLLKSEAELVIRPLLTL